MCRAIPSIEGSSVHGLLVVQVGAEAFSFEDLLAEPDQTTGWDGVRNFQARNFLRDQVKVGDGVLFYHSSADPPCIVGIAEVVRAGHPDPTAFDPKSDHYDPKSDPANPTWYQVSIKAVRAIDPPLGLPDLGGIPELAGMELLRKGSRLSVQPVTEGEWEAILELDANEGEAMSRQPRRIELRKTATMARIEHFAIYADDPTALKDFYVRTFGLRVIVESGGDPPGYFLADDAGHGDRDHRPARRRAERQPALGLPRRVLGRRRAGEEGRARAAGIRLRDRDRRRQRRDEDGVLQGPRREPLPDRLATAPLGA